jgi:hypothetical protein
MGIGRNERDMTGGMTALADTLMAYKYPRLTLETKVFEDETHLSVTPFFISRGLRAVFA